MNVYQCFQCVCGPECSCYFFRWSAGVGKGYVVIGIINLGCVGVHQIGGGCVFVGHVDVNCIGLDIY